MLLLGGLGHAPRKCLKIDALRLNLRAFQSQNNYEITTEGEHVIIIIMHDSATIKDFKTLNLTINKIPKGASQSQGGQKLPLKKLC